MKKKLILTTLAACFLATTVWGTQPLRCPFTVKQADGTTLTVSKRGNSRFHYLVTTDGLALLPDAAGNLCYAELAGDSLRPSVVVAHEAGARTPAEQAFAAAGADIIQCEKFSVETLTKFVTQAKQEFPQLIISAAGGINAANARAYAQTGVDFLVTTWPYFGKPADVKMQILAEDS